MGRQALTSNGSVIDLDREDNVESLPPESLAMSKETYGAGCLPSPSFSVVFNGEVTYVRKGFGQFYDTAAGERKLMTEIKQMKRFPKVYPVRLSQNHSNGDISYNIFMNIKGISHKVVLTYDRDHPNSQIKAIIEYPKLDHTRMNGHWYIDGKPCYIEFWNRSWTALKVATQVRYWLEDYYDDNSPYNRDFMTLRETQRILHELRGPVFWRVIRV